MKTILFGMTGMFVLTMVKYPAVFLSHKPSRVSLPCTRRRVMRKHLASLALLVAACATPSFAATTEIVYVTFNGSDTNPCTRIAPCKTITHALTVVAPAGHVDIVGSGTYDTFTITKSVTVEADHGVVATIVAPSSGTGITVMAGAGDVVTLRNIYVLGTGATFGIEIKSGGLISVEDCVSQNAFHALDYEPTVAGSHLSVRGGSYAGSDTGIFLCCFFGASFTAAIDSVHVYGGNARGINADGANITVTRSFLTGVGSAIGGGILVAHGKTVMENDVISAYEAGVDVFDTGSISSCTITGNVVGVRQDGGSTVFSRGNNTVVTNGTDVVGTLTSLSPL